MIESNYVIIALISFVVTLAGTYVMLPILKKKQFGQFIREEGPEAHKSKAGTPTMGGIAIAIGITVAIFCSGFITGDFGVEKVMVLFSMLAFGTIGFIDDYNKIAKKQNEGLTPIQKIILQVIFGLVLALFMLFTQGTLVFIPFVKTYVGFGWWYVPFIIFVEVAMANAVNLTDGLDGLASSTTAIVAALFSILGLFVIMDGDETLAACGQAILGACIGFLVLNKYPARIFMGDTGSMALGGALAATAIVSRMELLLPIAGLIFVMEALSVIIQVGYFKLTHGKRVFRMAPIHHHFELGGWSEVKVVLVFSAFTAICCVIARFSVL